MELEGLKIVKVEKPTSVSTKSPMEKARDKMIKALDHQSALAKDSKAKGRRWWFESNGITYMQIKYGQKSLLEEGEAVEIGSNTKVVSAINKIRKIVQGGKLDDKILATAEAMSKARAGKGGGRKSA